MQADVILGVNEIRSDELFGKTVIVIDVLRATSSIVTGLEHGAMEIVPVETVCSARSRQQPDDVLGGERLCKKIPGFDIGNSPLEYATPSIRGKRIIMTTTNGTRAIQKSNKAQHVLAGSLLNAHRCALAAVKLKRDVVIVCAGTQDRFSLEDGLCAGLIAAELADLVPDLSLNDAGSAMLSVYKYNQASIEDTIAGSENGIRLTRLGFADDVSFCSRVNSCQTVPILSGDSLIPFEF